MYGRVYWCISFTDDDDVDIVPIVMAGIIGIYGLVVSVLIANDLKQNLPLYTGFVQLGAGLAVGLAGLAAGYVLHLFGTMRC